MAIFPVPVAELSELAGIDDDHELTNRINVVRTHQVVFFGHIQRACQGGFFDVGYIEGIVPSGFVSRGKPCSLV